MTVIDFVANSPIWIKIIISIFGFYMISWFPRIIFGLNSIISELKRINKSISKIEGQIKDGLKSPYNTKATADFLLNLFEKSNRKDN